jgi:hypothetical protein
MKNFLKKFTLILALLVLSSSITFAGVFPDVPEDHTNYKAIEYLKEKGFIGGYSDLTFKPENKITRAEAVKIMVSALGLVSDEDFLVLFSDVVKDDWFFKFVMSAHKAGMVTVGSDNKFRPGDTINLAESLKIISEALKVDLSTYPDSDEWYSKYVSYAKDKNIVLMDDFGDVHVNEAMTRARFAEVMYRFLRVRDGGDEAFPIDEEWDKYESSLLPFNVKYPDGWQILKLESDTLDQVIFWKADASLYQFSPDKIYPNTAKFTVTIDSNSEKLSKSEYFSNIKFVFSSYDSKEFKVGNFDALEISNKETFLKDWYVYIDGKVLVVYTQNGNGVLGSQNRKFLDLMLKNFEYDEKGSAQAGAGTADGDLYAGIKSKILENILVEGQGNNMLGSLPSKVIISTDTIGVGTGPIDYYYCTELNMTLKYERASDVILDTRDGQTTAF